MNATATKARFLVLIESTPNAWDAEQVAPFCSIDHAATNAQWVSEYRKARFQVRDIFTGQVVGEFRGGLPI